MLVLKKGSEKSHISLHLFTLTHIYIKCAANVNIVETFD